MYCSSVVCTVAVVVVVTARVGFSSLIAVAVDDGLGWWGRKKRLIPAKQSGPRAVHGSFGLNRGQEWEEGGFRQLDRLL